MASSKTSTLVVKVISDASQAQRELADTASRIEGFQKKLVTAAAGLFAADKIADGIKGAINAASQLEQAVGGTDKVFKQSATAVHEWASDTTDAVRLPQAAYEQLATVIGAQLKNAGVSMSELAPKTKDLMELGADLAAAFGTDVPQAIEAISSALKGERDPIERYGVSLKQAAVNAKALELAQGDAALAATQALQAQATLALIYEQTADAQGAAAAESETFQARMDSLKEKLTNLGAAIGGPLIDGIGSLADRFSDLLPSIEPVAVAIGDFVGSIANLPTPVLAAATAVAALVLIGPKIVGAFANIGAAVVTMVGQLKTAAVFLLTTPWGLALTAAAAVATAALILWTDAASRAAEQARLTAKGVDAFYDVLKRGGTGGDLRSTATKLLQDEFEKLDTTVSDVAKNIGVSVDDMVTGLASNGREGSAVIDAFNAKIRELQAQMTPGAIGANGEIVPGIDNSAEIKKLEAQRDAYAGLAPSIEAARAKLDEYNRIMATSTGTTEDLEEATQDLKDALKNAQDAAKNFAANTEGALLLGDLAASASATTRAIQIYQASIDEATGHNRSYEDSQVAFNATILDIPEVFKKAGEGVGYNTDALKTWSTQVLTTSQGGQEIYKSLTGMADAANEATVRAYENATANNSQSDSIKIAAEQADNSYNQFVNMAGAMGLSRDEAVTLAGELGLLNKEQVDDKIFKIIAEDQKAQQTVKLWEAVHLDDVHQKYVADVPAAQELADQMNGIIDGTTPNPIPVVPEIQDPTNPGGTPAGAAAAGETPPTPPPVQVPTTVTPPTTLPSGPVGTAVQGSSSTGGTVNIPVTAPAIPDISAGLSDIERKSVTVIITADTTQAWSAVKLFTAAATVPLVVKLNGDPAQVNSVIRAVIGGQYSTTVHLQGDSVPVNNTIRAVIGGQYSTTVHINGDNSGAISAIRSITTGYYSATVHIGAEASGFYSVWNSLPSSKTITVTVNQVQGSVVPTAPSGLRAAPMVAATQQGFSLNARGAGPVGFAAPLKTSGNSAGGTVININVGVGDADEIARKVKQVLVARDRRAGGIVL